MSIKSSRKTKFRWLGPILILGFLNLVIDRPVNSLSPSPADQEEIPPAETDTTLHVEGRLVPYSYASLSLASSGSVAEVMVQEGERVEVGAVLLRLGGAEQHIADIATAELELLGARQSLDDLRRNAELELAQAEKALAEAQKILAFAESKAKSLQKGTPQSRIDQAYANMLLAEKALERIKDDQERWQQKFKNGNNIVHMYINKRQFKLLLTGLEKKVAYAERRYIDAMQKYDDLRKPIDPLDLAMAESDQALAQANVSDLEREVRALQNGPDLDELSMAEARIKAAKATLVAAETALSKLELKAPFSGEVVDLRVKAGERARANQPVIVLADTSQWIVETGDLTEIEVPNISVGDVVTVTPEALPELELGGEVISIKDLYEEKRGDITYTARLELNETDPRLRWGMTVLVAFGE